MVSANRLVLLSAPSSITGITRQFGNPVEAFEGPLQLKAIGLPTLVIHDRQDRELGFQHAEALAESVARFVVGEG